MEVSVRWLSGHQCANLQISGALLSLVQIISHSYHACSRHCCRPVFIQETSPVDASTAVKAPTVKLLIGGPFVESKTTEWRDVVNRAPRRGAAVRAGPGGGRPPPRPPPRRAAGRANGGGGGGPPPAPAAGQGL